MNSKDGVLYHPQIKPSYSSTLKPDIPCLLKRIDLLHERMTALDDRLFAVKMALERGRPKSEIIRMCHVEWRHG